jgi:hypothetical protein
MKTSIYNGVEDAFYDYIDYRDYQFEDVFGIPQQDLPKYVIYNNTPVYDQFGD